MIDFFERVWASAIGLEKRVDEELRVEALDYRIRAMEDRIRWLEHERERQIRGDGPKDDGT